MPSTAARSLLIKISPASSPSAMLAPKLPAFSSHILSVALSSPSPAGLKLILSLKATIISKIINTMAVIYKTSFLIFTMALNKQDINIFPA